MDVIVHGVRGHHQEFVMSKFDCRQVRLHVAKFIQLLRIRDSFILAINIGRGQSIQKSSCISALYQNLGHETHVKKGTAIAASLMFTFPVVKLMCSSKTPIRLVCQSGRRSEPGGSFPARNVTKMSMLILSGSYRAERLHVASRQVVL